MQGISLDIDELTLDTESLGKLQLALSAEGEWERTSVADEPSEMTLESVTYKITKAELLDENGEVERPLVVDADGNVSDTIKHTLLILTQREDAILDNLISERLNQAYGDAQ